MKKLYLLLLLTLTQSYSQCWKVVSAGYGFTLAIKTDGTLWGCGFNDDGELGDGSNARRHYFVQIGTDSNWKTVSGGAFHSLAIKDNGTLWSWGFNENGELGTGNTLGAITVVPTQIGTATDWQYVAAGGARSFAIKTNGTLWAWGSNSVSQLGDGTIINRTTPVQIGTDTDWKSVAPQGYGFAMALKTNGDIWGWGYSDSGEFASPIVSFSNHPILVLGYHNCKEISRSNSTSFSLTDYGYLYAWGKNEYGEFGNGTTTVSFAPTLISNSLWQHIASGLAHALGIKKDNSLWAWGANWRGQLGDGTIESRLIPTLVDNTAAYDTAMGGGEYSLALKSDGTLVGMGWNYYGQLGLGEAFNFYYPTAIACPSLMTKDFLINNNQMTIYPNPVQDRLYIQNTDNKAINKLTIVDMTGKVILENKDNAEINVESLQKGIYIIQIQSGTDSYSRKFIK